MRVDNVEKGYTGSLHSGFFPKDMYSEVGFPVEIGIYNVITLLLYTYFIPTWKKCKNSFYDGVKIQGFSLRRFHQPYVMRHWKGLRAPRWLLGGNESRDVCFAPVIVAETEEV